MCPFSSRATPTGSCPFVNTGKRLPGLIKDMDLVVIEEGPHAIKWTHAERVNELLLAFIQKGSSVSPLELVSSRESSSDEHP
jgi:hypothetical protein